jgi:phosphoserine phosphatase
MRIAALHLRHMIETSEDMDKTLVTLSREELAAYAGQSNHVTVPQHR